MPERYPEEFKKQVTAICVSGAPLATISKKYNISLNTLYRWRKEYQQAEDQATAKDYPTLYRRYERQDHILQIIRLSNIIDDVPVANVWKFWQNYMNSLSNTAFMNCVKP